MGKAFPSMGGGMIGSPTRPNRVPARARSAHRRGGAQRAVDDFRDDHTYTNAKDCLSWGRAWQQAVAMIIVAYYNIGSCLEAMAGVEWSHPNWSKALHSFRAAVLIAEEHIEDRQLVHVVMQGEGAAVMRRSADLPLRILIISLYGR